MELFCVLYCIWSPKVCACPYNSKEYVEYTWSYAHCLIQGMFLLSSASQNSANVSTYTYISCDYTLNLPHCIHHTLSHAHTCGVCTGFLRKIGQDDILYKPVQPGVKGSIEVQFYESLFGSTDLPTEVFNLRELVPNYYGRETICDRAGQLRILLIIAVYH